MNAQPSFYVFAAYENLGAIYEPITEIMYRSLEQIMVMQNALGNRERLFIYNYHSEAEAARNEMLKPVEWDYTNID